ncbi:hypothetical protein ACFVRR_17585 [Gottfriedia sp. NPDC057948]|uniref:hypothetical protein n=1 Tax=Gottfriedia sp. NPDC057948 TaxID=3346287 RepID=UPI0036D8ABD9
MRWVINILFVLLLCGYFILDKKGVRQNKKLTRVIWILIALISIALLVINNLDY